MREIVYSGHDNLITLQLLDDSAIQGTLAPTDLSLVTRVTLDFCDGTVIDSAVNADFFDWSAGEGYIDFKLGTAGLDAGTHSASIILYDDANTNGVRWEPKLRIKVESC